MGLKDVELREDRTYNTLENNPASTFFVPCLKEAVAYDRAVGYFRSSVFTLIGAGFDEIVKKGGKIRVIASPHLDEDDIDRINSGYELRQAIEESMSQSLEMLSDTEQKQLGYLGRLIAGGHLDFKIAVARVGEKVGLYHDKYGIITDEGGEKIVFSGSNNETYHALRLNSETFTVHCPWDGVPSKKIIERFGNDFERLWNGELGHVEVFNLPEITYKKLRELAAEIPDDFVPEFELPPFSGDTKIKDRNEEEDDQPITVNTVSLEYPQIPQWLNLRDYQELAITEWFKNNGRGVFKMATGTGKTVTALALASRFLKKFFDAGQPMLLIVVCPLKHLVDQWAENAQDFGINPIKCYDENPNWQARVRSMIQHLNFGGPQIETVIVTNDTFRGEKFQNLLAQYNREVLLIADEVHNFGSGLLHSRLPQKIKFRLGLSATPERFDVEETQKIYEYFGEVIFQLDLKAAIEMGALCKYRYRVVPTFLDSEEMQKYIELAKEIGRMYAIRGAGAGVDDEGGRLGSLLGERARLLGHCAGKIPALKLELMKHKESMFQLVYCAEGRPPMRDDDAQIDVVQSFIGLELEARASKYVHGTSRHERKQLLKRFSSGTDLRYLLSMKCLDEGVDIPDARYAYILASSRNPRQSVQRRGRVLRKSENDAGKIAEIIDFLALPNPELFDASDAECEIELRLITQELERARDFADLALNKTEAVASIDAIMTIFGIDGEEKNV